MRNSETDRLYRIALEGHCKITTACTMWNGHGMTCIQRMNVYQRDVAAEAAARKAACEWESQREKVAPVLTVDELVCQRYYTAPNAGGDTLVNVTFDECATFGEDGLRIVMRCTKRFRAGGI